MTQKDIMYKFIYLINKNKLTTLFLKNIFNYECLNDYNYIFRLSKEKECIIIDIYDNFSIHRFNRYIFNFDKAVYTYDTIKDNNVYITYIGIQEIKDSNIKLLKLGYLFKIDNHEKIEYARNFLEDEFIKLLDKIINKPKK